MTSQSNTQVVRKDPERAEAVQQRPAVTPPVDIFESREHYLVLADMPGASQQSLAVHVDRGQLSLEGRATGLPGQSGPGAEFDYRRTFVLPRGVDESKIEAQLSAGVLTLRLPKREALKPRKIEVKAL